VALESKELSCLDLPGSWAVISEIARGLHAVGVTKGEHLLIYEAAALTRRVFDNAMRARIERLYTYASAALGSPARAFGRNAGEPHAQARRAPKQPGCGRHRHRRRGFHSRRVVAGRAFPRRTVPVVQVQQDFRAAILVGS
jgi:hypothetical protein